MSVTLTRESLLRSSKLTNKKYEHAEALFIDIINDNDNLLVDQAAWNLGLCYLVNGKTTKAKEVFSKISVGNTIYNKDASNILQEMESK